MFWFCRLRSYDSFLFSLRLYMVWVWVLAWFIWYDIGLMSYGICYDLLGDDYDDGLDLYDIVRPST